MANLGPAVVNTTNTQTPFGNAQSIETLTVTLTPTTATINSVQEMTFSGLGTNIAVGDVIVGVSKPTQTAGVGVVGWRVDGTTADKFYVSFANVTGTTVTPAAEAYLITVLKRNSAANPLSAEV
jgi:hypothetical protein